MCVLGEFYDRNYIQEHFGGGNVIFLPNKNDVVTCACLNPDRNICSIDNQVRILVGEGPRRRPAANLLINESNRTRPLRVFVKRAVNNYEYMGKFIVTEHTENINEINLFCDELQLEHNRIMAILMTKVSD